MKKILILILLVIIFTGDKVMANAVLNKKQENIVKISVYTAAGDMPKLKNALNKGLDDGLTVNEIKEVLVQMYAYCGFPRSLNGISALMSVLEQRKDKNDKIGEEGKPLSADVDKFKCGDEVQVELTGDHVKGALFDFAPAMDSFLKEHLFADIFARGVLSHQEREVATIAALASMDNVEPQLSAHIQMGKNTGLSNEQIKEILTLATVPKAEMFATGEPNTASLPR